MHSAAIPPELADAAEAMLDFRLHILSPRHIGTTLVWLISPNRRSLNEHLSRPPRQLGAELTLTGRHDQEVLATLLAHLDGACILNAEARVQGVEAVLQFSDNASDLVVTSGGTRHNSAAKFSFDFPDAIVCVVSADGPVSIFSDGVRIMHVEDKDSWILEDYAYAVKR